MNMILYGIPNCDTVRKARKFLEERQIDYRFHDFKKDGLTQETIQKWLQNLPIEILVNKRSTSWKQLTEQQKENLMNQSDLTVLTEMPTLIKRPVLETANVLLVGFKADEYQALK
ncbi:ArsC family reductase [Thiomicrorhabdus sp. ZW0627]|uniref:ArsC family reductase n=1 Tax=Thiomicrorhabdus sp. ZW0627 TaxID=3039774 RepID=UPI0024365D5C|nr:ArsC family reductase [Thiomicrorhabdus sp. ZW0627]MDG6773009.1 ArsC family reductase [Thiomicrorhabdus sp. ZW0627]